MLPLLLTRPETQSHRFAQQCRAAGFAGPVTISPILDIVPMSSGVALADYPTLLFTSQNALDHAPRPFPPDRQAYAVGDRTAGAVRAAGLACRSAGGSLDDLLALLLCDSPPGPLLHLRGAHATGGLAARLTAAGLPAQDAVVYDQRARALSPEATVLLAGEGPVVVPLFSPRSAALLAQALPPRPAELRLIAISPAVGAAWREGGRMQVAPRPDAAAMIDLVLKQASP